MPSEKILEQKKQQVAQLAEDFKKANVGVLVNYEGITVEKDKQCVKQGRKPRRGAAARFPNVACDAFPRYSPERRF